MGCPFLSTLAGSGYGGGSGNYLNMIFLRYINHIKSYFFTELNENKFYMKIVDLDEIYNFLVLSFFILSR